MTIKAKSGFSTINRENGLNSITVTGDISEDNPEAAEEITKRIENSYVILFNKIFVLESLDGEKIMLTYNVDMGNSKVSNIIDNTIYNILILYYDHDDDTITT